jgi:ankyrin repeat protein
MIAAELGHVAVVDLLVRRGADTGIRDKAGKTARDLASNEALRAKLTAN